MKKSAFSFFFIGFFFIACTSKEEKLKFFNSAYLDELNEQVSKNPDSTNFRLKLVNALDSAAMYKESLAQMDKLISKDSLNNAFWFIKGQVQEHSADTPNAIISYNRSVKIYPTANALLSLANMYAETRNPKTLEVCAAIKELYPDREHLGDAMFFEGVYHTRIGNKEKAVDLFNASINFNYTLMDTYIELGSIYYEEKKHAEAIKIFQTAASINNTYADAYYWLGKCFEAMNYKDSAVFNYQKVIVLDKNFKEAEEALKRLK